MPAALEQSVDEGRERRALGEDEEDSENDEHEHQRQKPPAPAHADELEKLAEDPEPTATFPAAAHGGPAVRKPMELSVESGNVALRIQVKVDPTPLRQDPPRMTFSSPSAGGEWGDR